MARSAPTPPASNARPEAAEAPTAPKRFTADEASTALVYLAPIVAEIKSCFERIASQRENLDSNAAGTANPAEQELVLANQQAMADLARLVDEVQAVGAEMRDFETGAVAFPGQGHGVPERGFLSWKLGEARVDHAHGPDEPTEARRLLRPKARRRAA